MTYYTATVRLGLQQAKTLNGIRYKAVRTLRKLAPADKVWGVYSHFLNISYNDREMKDMSKWVGNVSRTVIASKDGPKEDLTWVEWRWENGKMVDQETYYIDDSGRITGRAEGRYSYFARRND